MIFLIFFALFLGFLGQGFFFKISYLSADFHQLCLQLSPLSPHRPFYQALVCGKKLDQNHQFHIIQTVGMLHLLVVSGAHLIFLRRFLRILTVGKLSILFEIILLFFLVVACQFQITAFRAWCVNLLSFLNQRYKLYLQPIDLILVSVIFCLSLNPLQKFSNSMLMSWLACLGLVKGKNPISQSTWCYLFLSPVLIGMQSLSPWTILINTFLTPIVGYLLLPTSLTSFILPFFTPFTDQLWELFFKMASWLEFHLGPPPETYLSISSSLLWIYALGVHFIVRHFSRNQS